jgi:hypothetical protein
VEAHAAEAKQIHAKLGAAQKHTEVLKKHGPKLAATQDLFRRAAAPCAQDKAVAQAAQRFILALQGRSK